MADTPRHAEQRRRGRPRHETPSAEYVAKLDEIISVATEVFRERGYDAGSLEDVASALGLRKASLYYYVESKSALLHLIFDRAISEALVQLHALERVQDPDARLRALIRHQAIRVSSEPSLFTVFFDQRPSLRDDHHHEIILKERAYVRAFIEGVEAAIDAGTLPDANPRILANLLIGMTSWSYKWFSPSRDDPDEFANTCVQLVLGPTESHRPPPTRSRRLNRESEEI